MEDTWSEYVDLISTASMELHPDNHGSSFTNELVIPQHLPENAYVSLEEISYVSTFYNIRQSQNSITIYDMLYEHPPNSPRNPNPYPTYGHFFVCPLKPGNYNSMERLCQAINQAIKDSGVEQVKDRDIFTYDPITLKFSYNVEDLWLSVWLRGDILNYLGVEVTQATFNQYVVLGKPKLKPSYEYPKSLIKPKKPVRGGFLGRPEMPYADVKETVTRHFDNPRLTWDSIDAVKDEFEFVGQLRIIDSFVIYIDCIASQVTGDVFSDALRIIPIKEEKVGTNVTHSFQKVYPLKVNKRYIPSIKVEIRDLYDEFIDFKVGAVRLKLRFTTQP